MKPAAQKRLWAGIAMAVLATVIWSGNFIVARGVIHDIPPVTLAFFRWLTATVIMLPLAWKELRSAMPVIRQHLPYFCWTAFTGVTLFNTFVYIAGHYSPAINLALIGTTSSPVMAIILARFVLGEKITAQRVAGLSLCIAGILFLLSRGTLQNLLQLQFGKGDAWILAAALAFAVYNTQVRKKPAGIGPLGFLFSVFAIGTLFLVPAYLYELTNSAPVQWTGALAGVIIYLGLGTSVIAFLFWNAAIQRLGAARTALFGNLIPVFSSLEAVWLLHEKVTWVHAISGLLVIGGLVLANLDKSQAGSQTGVQVGSR